MKKLFTIFMLLTLVIIAVPAYAGSGSLNLGVSSGGVSITSRESHTGKPDPGAGVSGSLDRLGSGSLSGRSSTGRGSGSIFAPVRTGGAITYFTWLYFVIRTSPSRLF